VFDDDRLVLNAALYTRWESTAGTQAGLEGVMRFVRDPVQEDVVFREPASLWDQRIPGWRRWTYGKQIK
jgi:hypothetical protein